MNLKLERTAPQAVEADALIILEFEDSSSLPPGYEPMREGGELTGKPAEFALIHHAPGYKAHRLLMAGAGPRQKFGTAEVRKIAGSATRFLKARSIRAAAFLLSEDFSTPDHVAAVVEGALLGDFECDVHKSDRKDSRFLDSLTVVVGSDDPALETGLERGRVLGESQNFARELANEPPNVLTPLTLAARAQEMARETGLDCEILDQPRMQQLGMGALLGVAQGSAEPPCLIILRYSPEGKGASKAHLGLVGKGVTFDTGGISIKPSEHMDKMKFDMAGGAAVIGAMRAIARLKPSIHVTGMIPAVENMPGSKAQRPGDIVTSFSGKTIEILNTDAEGRLILADALAYAQKLGCTHLVDAATLTGAIVVALGHHNTGVFSNDAALQERWRHASRHEGERMWEMPVEPEYREQLKTTSADIANIGGRDGGSVTAAMFLKEFVGETPWLHLDIAGTAWIDDDKPWMAKGPTGLPVRSFVALATQWRD